jgi:hypothetical protein
MPPRDDGSIDEVPGGASCENMEPRSVTGNWGYPEPATGHRPMGDALNGFTHLSQAGRGNSPIPLGD